MGLENLVSENLTRYQYGELANRLYKSEEGRIYSGGALEQLAYDLGIENLGEGFIKGALASEEGIKTTIKVYSEKYQKALGESKVNELLTYHDNLLKKYLNEKEIEKLRTELKEFSEEKFGEINEKIRRATYILQGEKIYNFSDKEKKEAEETLKKYHRVFGIIQLLENAKFENLRLNAVNMYFKKTFKESVKL